MIVFFSIVYIAVSGLVALLVIKGAKLWFPGNIVGAFLTALISAIIGGVFYSVFKDFFSKTLTQLFNAVNLYPPLFTSLIVVFTIALLINQKRSK